MATLMSYELKGNKQSFANWISNLSPCETPFISMISKESVDQVQYSWQTDHLNGAGMDSNNTALDEIKEGEATAYGTLLPTVVETNFTKIFRKAVKVTDTTKQIGLWGRASELPYQMEKAGMELKRDVEHYFLTSTVVGKLGTSAAASESSGVQKLVAPKDSTDLGTGAIVHFEAVPYAANAHHFTKEDIFKMTYNLYLAGAEANKIMVHPVHMQTFSDFIGDVRPAGAVAKTPHLHRMFDGLDQKYNAFVQKIRDPLGQDFEVIPNRFMPKDQIFFFNPKDWTQTVLRAPEKTELGRTGSTQKFLIEMEVGLRHRNPFASGILILKKNTRSADEAPVAAPAEAEAEVVAEKAPRARKTAK